jgi:dimethylargininase
MFSSAIVRPPGTNYADGLTRIALGPPDYSRALRQHRAYCEALQRCGLDLIHLEADKRYPDSTFVEDTAVTIPTAAILTRPGADSRMGEVVSIKETLSRLYQRIASIQGPGTLDGGDVCEAGNVFFIGLSERTNEAGAGQLAELLTPYGYTSSFVDIRTMKDILHLKSGLAYLGDNRLVVIEALAKREQFRGYDLVRVNADEGYAANCVRVNDYVLVAAGYPMFEQSLRGLGYKTIPLEMTEFQKMDGGLSCLSLRF